MQLMSLLLLLLPPPDLLCVEPQLLLQLQLLLNLLLPDGIKVNYKRDFLSVLRIWIWDPGSGTFLTPGSGILDG
jgi:hypothetical protein